MSAVLRMATESDGAQVAAIYAPVVRETAISFEIDPPGETEMRQRIASTLKQFPWLVCESAGEVWGYVYASPHRTRAAYQWSVDVTAYVHPAHRRKGVGRALYTALLGVLPLQGYYNAYAGITLPNPSSVGLHEAMGFEPVGVYRKVGYKLGRWHDVGWWSLALCDHDLAPTAPLPVTAVQEQPEWQAGLARGLASLGTN
jgi:L-amino acid N-acyltransferase YncA